MSGNVSDLLFAYMVTFGWAILGSVSMGIGLVIMLSIFTRMTKEVDEWKLINEGNIAMAIVLAAVIIACGMVVAAAIRP